MRAVLVDDRTTRRCCATIVERAHARGMPVVVGCADDTARRRAVELQRRGVVSAVRPTPRRSPRACASAVARGAAAATRHGDRVERVEYEQMLHDSLTGLPTLPVMIERSRQLFKERGELVVLYLNFVRYSKIEEIYGWEKLDAVLETTAARGARVPRRHGARARRA